MVRVAFTGEQAVRDSSRGRGKEQFVAIGVVYLDHVVSPPGDLVRHRAIDELPVKFGKATPSQLDEKPCPVTACGILAENQLALSTIDLRDFARAVALMPALFEAEHVDVETNGAVNVRDKQHGPRVPPMHRLIWLGFVWHCLFRMSLAHETRFCRDEVALKTVLITMRRRRRCVAAGALVDAHPADYTHGLPEPPTHDRYAPTPRALRPNYDAERLVRELLPPAAMLPLDACRCRLDKYFVQRHIKIGDLAYQWARRALVEQDTH